MPVHDQLHRFIFNNAEVRGELVNVSQTLQDILRDHDYPQPVQALLGELLVATSLMTATLKFEGDITVQLQGDGPLSMAVVNGNNHQQLRGVARMRGDIPDGATLKEMAGNGYLIITITPAKGERYQGVVGLEGETIAECLEDYFARSEQLPTRLIIRQNAQGAGGILLQVLPSRDAGKDEFEHLVALADALKAEELTSLSATDVLWRLYHQEEVTVFDPVTVEFKCTCSRERCGDVLKTVAADEIDEILAEDGKIDMHCDYCGAHYIYDAVDVENIRNNALTGHHSIH